MDAPTYQAAHDLYAEEARRVCAILADLITESNRSRIAIERHLGLSPTSLGKVLSGTLRLSYGHVLAVLDALELDRGEFFARLYPVKNALPDERLEKVLAGGPAVPGPTRTPDPTVVQATATAEVALPAAEAPGPGPLPQAVQEWLETMLRQIVADHFKRT